jgi:hypothetical protein
MSGFAFSATKKKKKKKDERHEYFQQYSTKPAKGRA